MTETTKRVADVLRPQRTGEIVNPCVVRTVLVPEPDYDAMRRLCHDE